MSSRWNRSRRPKVAVAVVLAVVACVTGRAAAVSQPEQRALVPAYFYPDHWNVGNDWVVMCDGLEASAQSSVVVMNPNSGPDTRRNPDYQVVLSYCQAAGQEVIGYVHTSYGQRSSRSVKADIDAYYRYYPDIDGIFLDEMSNQPSTQSYYRSLYRHVKGKPGASNLVVGNPGAAAATSWQLDTPVTDALIVFEGTSAAFSAWTPPAWVLSQPSSRIVQLVHASPDATDMVETCTRSQQMNAGLVYVTDDVLENPWDSLPPYWQDELQAC